MQRRPRRRPRRPRRRAHGAKRAERTASREPIRSVEKDAGVAARVLTPPRGESQAVVREFVNVGHFRPALQDHVVLAGGVVLAGADLLQLFWGLSVPSSSSVSPDDSGTSSGSSRKRVVGELSSARTARVAFFIGSCRRRIVHLPHGWIHPTQEDTLVVTYGPHGFWSRMNLLAKASFHSPDEHEYFSSSTS